MKKIWIFMLKIAIAVLIVAYLIHVHYNSFINGLQKFNPVWLPAAVSVLLFEMVFCAWRWFSLLKTAGLEIKWFEALSLTMRGYFCSLILFGGAIGGYLGMKTFRHKTKHWYFHAINILGIAWQVSLLAYLILLEL